MSARVDLPREKADLTSMSLYAVVKAKDKDDQPWKEVADLISVSATGSSFNLPRPCEVGTLVSLMIPLPAHLRCYDHDKEFYRVWGLVQHCETVTADEPASYHIGVAFIGKNAPKSYRQDSNQHYRIAGVDDDGMWTVEEARSPFKKRADVRFWKPIELYLALIDTSSGSSGGERTLAENVSKSGAAVYTTLDVGIGDRVKFISAEYDFSGLAVVCNSQPGDDERTRLHLNFVENTFPIEKIMSQDVVVEKVLG
jgi:hypothetical protein